MFTGIVTDIGIISQVEQRGDMRLVIRDEVWRQMRQGPEAVKSFDADLRLSRRDGDIQFAVAHKPSDPLSAGDAGSRYEGGPGQHPQGGDRCRRRCRRGARRGDADRLGGLDARDGRPLLHLRLVDRRRREPGGISGRRHREGQVVGGQVGDRRGGLAGKARGQRSEERDEECDEQDDGTDEGETTSGVAQVAQGDEHGSTVVPNGGSAQPPTGVPGAVSNQPPQGSTAPINGANPPPTAANAQQADSPAP